MTVRAVNLSLKINKKKDMKMKQTILCIFFLFLSWQVFAKDNESIDCVNLALDNDKAKIIALMRAKAHWVEHHHGRVVSGTETLLTEDNKSQLIQTIKTESAGRVPPLSSPQVKQSERIKMIKDKPYLCIYLKTSN